MLRRQVTAFEKLPPGPRRSEVERYTRLFCYCLGVELLFDLACLFSFAGAIAGITMILTPIIGPVMIEDGWVFIVSFVLLIPLYHLRKKVDCLFAAAKHQLEQVGLPQPRES